MHRKWGLILFFIIALGQKYNLSAQGLTIGGIVKDMNTYQELRGVNIYIKGTTLGTSTDYTGKFYLAIPKTSPDMIVVFQHIAYEIAEIPLDSLRTVKNIYLKAGRFTQQRKLVLIR